MADRTPTKLKLKNLEDALDMATEYVCTHVQYRDLDENAMFEIMRFLGQNHSKKIKVGFEGSATLKGSRLYEPSIYSIKSKVVFYDIAYKLIRKQLEKESDMPTEEKKLFFDAVMGKLWYDPGTAHDREMAQSLREYVSKYRVERLNSNFAKVKERFNQFRQTARTAEEQLTESLDPKDIAYVTMFTQFFAYFRGKSYMDFRQEQIMLLVRGFNPPVS